MPALTRWFGVTERDAERDFAAEPARTDEILEKVLLMQASAAAKQHRPLCRGTHAKGTAARAQFEVFGPDPKRDAALNARLAYGVFAWPGIYPAIVRFGNSDSCINSDFRGDIRSLSFSVDASAGGASGRQDFTLQSAETLPLNDGPAFLATMRVLTAASPARTLLALPMRDKLRVLRALALAALQERQPVQAYQTLRYWSTVPFAHGPDSVVKQSAVPSAANHALPLDKKNRNALQDELERHLDEDATMSSFEFGLQFLDIETMTYWGRHRDASFWTENASVLWKESQAPFHAVGRLTLLPSSMLRSSESDNVYFDVTSHALPDSQPLGSINRTRCPAETASRKARGVPSGIDDTALPQGKHS